MSKNKPAPAIEPTDTVGSIFAARRDLLPGVKAVVAGSGFTVEETDLLACLYGVRELRWVDLPHDEEDYVVRRKRKTFRVRLNWPRAFKISVFISRVSRRSRGSAAAQIPFKTVHNGTASRHFSRK